MMSAHTMRHMRSEYFQGNGVSDRRIRSQWEQGGSLDARERARGIARKILAAPVAPYLPADVDRTIRETFNIRLGEN
jgi:trimethylamine--corrinoid protein Co-methyltransferase